MSSIAHQIWFSARAARLDEVELAHTAVRGTGSSRRYATQQLNHAYTVLLAAEFQGVCRELHSEAVVALLAAMPKAVQKIVAEEFTWNRQLDRANATSSALGSDFGRLGIELWSRVDVIDANGPALRRALDELITWRNAIAHHDFQTARLGGKMALPIRRVRRWRKTCSRIVRVLDRLLREHILQLTGHVPWA